MKLRDALAFGALAACSPAETTRPDSFWHEPSEPATNVDVKGCLEVSEPSIGWTSPDVEDLVPEAEALLRVAVKLNSACEGVAEDVNATLSLMGDSCDVELGDLSPDYQNTLACIFPLQGQPGDWTFAVDLTASNQDPTQRFIDLRQPSSKDCMPNILFAEELASSCSLDAPFAEVNPDGAYIDSPYSDFSAWAAEQNWGLGRNWDCATTGALATTLVFATGTSLSTKPGLCEGTEVEALAVNTLVEMGFAIADCDLTHKPTAAEARFAVDAVCGQ